MSYYLDTEKILHKTSNIPSGDGDIFAGHGTDDQKKFWSDLLDVRNQALKDAEERLPLNVMEQIRTLHKRSEYLSNLQEDTKMHQTKNRSLLLGLTLLRHELHRSIDRLASEKPITIYIDNNNMLGITHVPIAPSNLCLPQLADNEMPISLKREYLYQVFGITKTNWTSRVPQTLENNQYIDFLTNNYRKTLEELYINQPTFVGAITSPPQSIAENMLERYRATDTTSRTYSKALTAYLKLKKSLNEVQQITFDGILSGADDVVQEGLTIFQNRPELIPGYVKALTFDRPEPLRNNYHQLSTTTPINPFHQSLLINMQKETAATALTNNIPTSAIFELTPVSLPNNYESQFTEGRLPVDPDFWHPLPPPIEASLTVDQHEYRLNTRYPNPHSPGKIMQVEIMGDPTKNLPTDWSLLELPNNPEVRNIAETVQAVGLRIAKQRGHEFHVPQKPDQLSRQYNNIAITIEQPDPQLPSNKRKNNPTNPSANQHPTPRISSPSKDQPWIYPPIHYGEKKITDFSIANAPIAEQIAVRTAINQFNQHNQKLIKDIAKLEGYDATFRLRIGNWRIICQKITGETGKPDQLVIIDITNRKDAYKE